MKMAKNKTKGKNKAKFNDSSDEECNGTSPDISKKKKSTRQPIPKKKSESKAIFNGTPMEEQMKFYVDSLTREGSIVQNYLNLQFGTNITKRSSSKSIRDVLVGCVSRLRPYRTVSPFDRRVTALALNELLPNVAAAGSKGGEIIWWDFNKSSKEQATIPGVGPGGSITSMQFHRSKPSLIYTASITGKVMLQDFEGKHSHCFLDTCTLQNWFTSLDVQPQQELLATGDTKGYLYLISDKDGTLIWKAPKRVHKSKINHVEFHRSQPYLLATASVDHSVKLWDMRKLETALDALCVLPHNKGVNSACFNPSNGQFLLTSDQHSELRVFQGPHWDLHGCIPHPHRQFQHLTPIRASWHPCLDVIVVGRYPDEQFKRGDKRCIDFFDSVSGKLLYQLTDPFAPGIVSLNLFNRSGDTLVSGMGYQVVVWKPWNEDEESSGHLLATAKAPKGNPPKPRTLSQKTSQKTKNKSKFPEKKNL